MPICVFCAVTILMTAQGDAVVCRKEIHGVVVHVYVWGKELSNFNAAYSICGEWVYKKLLLVELKFL